MDEMDFDGDEDTALTRTSALTTWPSFIHEKKKKGWKIWTPLITEYHNALDNPKSLPKFMHPFISKERQFVYGAHRPHVKHFLNIQVDMPDDRGVHRRVYLHLCKENFVVGAATGTLVGVTTGFYTPANHHLAPFLAHRRLMGKPLGALARMAFSGTIMTATFSRRLVFRAVIGGILYDVLKRNRDENDYLNQYLNAGYAGAIGGLIFGIRGGLPHAWAAAAMASTAAVLSEFLPWRFKDSEVRAK